MSGIQICFQIVYQWNVIKWNNTQVQYVLKTDNTIVLNHVNSATTTNSYGIIFSLYLNITKHASCSKVIFEAQPVFRACSCVEYVLFWMDRTESRRDCSLTVPTNEILLNGSLACFKNAKQIVCFVKCLENMIPGNVYSKIRTSSSSHWKLTMIYSYMYIIVELALNNNHSLTPLCTVVAI